MQCIALRKPNAFLNETVVLLIICLPPHTTHILQPLDVSVFKSVKHVWARLLKEFKSEKFEAVVSKRSFPSLSSQLWKESFLPEHSVSGFRANGIHPLNRSIIREDKLKPSEAYSGTSTNRTTLVSYSCNRTRHSNF